MEDAELIKKLRILGYHTEDIKIMREAADALEAADRRVKELEEKNKALKKELKEQEDIWNHPEKLGEMLAGL